MIICNKDKWLNIPWPYFVVFAHSFNVVDQRKTFLWDIVIIIIQLCNQLLWNAVSEFHQYSLDCLSTDLTDTNYAIYSACTWLSGNRGLENILISSGFSGFRCKDFAHTQSCDQSFQFFLILIWLFSSILNRMQFTILPFSRLPNIALYTLN